jgi:hypothetical protein
LSSAKGFVGVIDAAVQNTKLGNGEEIEVISINPWLARLELIPCHLHIV